MNLYLVHFNFGSSFNYLDYVTFDKNTFHFSTLNSPPTSNYEFFDTSDILFLNFDPTYSRKNTNTTNHQFPTQNAVSSGQILKSYYYNPYLQTIVITYTKFHRNLTIGLTKNCWSNHFTASSTSLTLNDHSSITWNF